jgi:hypothetical protein
VLGILDQIELDEGRAKALHAVAAVDHRAVLDRRIGFAPARAALTLQRHRSSGAGMSAVSVVRSICLVAVAAMYVRR